MSPPSPPSNRQVAKPSLFLTTRDLATLLTSLFSSWAPGTERRYLAPVRIFLLSCDCPGRPCSPTWPCGPSSLRHPEPASSGPAVVANTGQQIVAGRRQGPPTLL